MILSETIQSYIYNIQLASHSISWDTGTVFPKLWFTNNKLYKRLHTMLKHVEFYSIIISVLLAQASPNASENELGLKSSTPIDTYIIHQLSLYIRWADLSLNIYESSYRANSFRTLHLNSSHVLSFFLKLMFIFEFIKLILITLSLTTFH